MNTRKLKHLFIFFILTTIILLGLYYKHTSDKNAERYYRQGMQLYSEKKYSDAYYNFKQIKPISELYEIALLKQYQCANNLDDKKTSLIKLRELIKKTKNIYIKPWAQYQETILSQELKLSPEAIIIKKFKQIKTNYPDSDFSIASAYKLAQLTKESTPSMAKKSYLDYLSYAPNGKFSLNATEDLLKLNIVLTKEDYEIIADSLLKNEKYQSALNNYQKTTFSKNWYKISKCYRNLNNAEQEKQIILKGLNLPISDVEEKDISNAIDRLITINKANKLQLLQELYTIYQDSYIFPTVVYKLAEASSSIRAIKLHELVANEYPASIWASNSLWEVFWYNYEQSRFETCEKLAKQHLNQYFKTQDSPRIAYWYARALLKTKKHMQAREVFYDIINDYPLSYYAFLSAKQLKKSKAKKMIVKKPITQYDRKILDKLIFEDKTLLKIAQTGDWELIDAFKINNEYIKSWIAFEKENPTTAINIAKNELIKDKKEEITSGNKETDIKFSNQMLKMIYPIFYEKEVNNFAHKSNLSPYLFLSLIREESHFNKNAKSSAGALGLTQLMQDTANFIEKKPVSKETLYNPSENIRIGMSYFDYLIKYFNGSEYLAILAYNAGPGNVKKWLSDTSIKSDDIDEFVENVPFLETKNYIKKILSSYWIYLNIYSAKNK